MGVHMPGVFKGFGLREDKNNIRLLSFGACLERVSRREMRVLRARGEKKWFSTSYLRKQQGILVEIPIRSLEMW